MYMNVPLHSHFLIEASFFLEKNVAAWLSVTVKDVQVRPHVSKISHLEQAPAQWSSSLGRVSAGKHPLALLLGILPEGEVWEAPAEYTPITPVPARRCTIDKYSSKEIEKPPYFYWIFWGWWYSLIIICFRWQMGQVWKSLQRPQSLLTSRV